MEELRKNSSSNDDSVWIKIQEKGWHMILTLQRQRLYLYSRDMAKAAYCGTYRETAGVQPAMGPSQPTARSADRNRWRLGLRGKSRHI